MEIKLNAIKKYLFWEQLPDNYDKYFNIIMDKASSSENLKKVLDCPEKDIRKHENQLSSARYLFNNAKLKYAEAYLEER